MVPLTKRQREILDYLTGYIGDHGYAPSFEEIASAMKYASLATVHEHLSNLERKGVIRRSYNESRSIEVLSRARAPGVVEVPLLGAVAAGEPIEAVQEQETIILPEDMLPATGPNYVLRVRGDSMIEEQIRDGDYVVVTSRNSARNGEMVIALLQGTHATVKKFYREKSGWIRLQPANAAVEPIVVHEDDVTIQGVVVGVIRKY
ncbi:MAG TPA: transcriptional repressor LexA [Gemmatimonadales bacterium]|nr:transcriptional repressor LexA [Gemmatimonadales bacterium]